MCKNRPIHFRRSLVRLFIFLLAWSFLQPERAPAAFAQGNTLYVKPFSTGMGDCHAWEHACLLQTALTNAVSGDQIWVAAGPYLPTAGSGIGPTFQLKAGVAVYGGFAANETALSQRDWEGNTTILSGELGFPGTPEDNAYHVVSSFGMTETAILDGFTITGGNVTITDTVYGSGGGIFNYFSSPTLRNLTFIGNMAGMGGGGMGNIYFSDPVLSNVTFRDNKAEAGGGMFNYVSSPMLTNVSFIGNTATYGGGMYNMGSMRFGYSDPTLINVTFSGNSADYGGGMGNSLSSPRLSNVTFSGNSANNGGGISSNASYHELTNVTFSGNSAQSNGGGIFNYSATIKMSNSVLWGDTGGEIYNSLYGSTTVSSSIIQGGYTGTGNIDADPLLGTPVDYGVGAQVLPLRPGSPAIDAGEPGVCPPIDQRGQPRPVDGDGDGQMRCDMGAFEYTILLPRVYLMLQLR